MMKSFVSYNVKQLLEEVNRWSALIGASIVGRYSLFEV